MWMGILNSVFRPREATREAEEAFSGVVEHLGALRDQGLVRQHPVLGRIVVWADVVAAIQGPPPDDAPTGAPSGLPRLTLRRRR
jgi:hypothetical protein